MKLWIREQLPRVHRKESLRCEEVGECVQWKAKRHCSKGDLCSFTRDPVSGNRYENQRGKGQSSSVAPDTKAKTNWQTPFKRSGSRGQSPWEGRDRFHRRNKNCEDPSCNYWHPPARQNYKSETGCIYCASFACSATRSTTDGV